MYTILVVDDEKDIVSALEIYLKAEGYRVLSACNGKKALAAAAREDVPLNAAGAIAVHIRHLREKLEINPSEPRYIKVVWGKGYKMEGGIS